MAIIKNRRYRLPALVLVVLVVVVVVGSAVGYGFLHDQPPVAEFTKRPERIGGSRLRLAYRATDDRSLKSLRLEIRLQDRTLLAGNQITTLELPINFATPDRRRIEGRLNLDLSALPWAGMAVDIRLVARDGDGQEGAGKNIKTVLPQRRFRNRVARAIIVQRRRLAMLKADSRQKIEADIIVGLQLIKDRPRAYRNDITVFLSLSDAQARLKYGSGGRNYDSVMRLLWNIATGLERQNGAPPPS